jgi:hypothetical protein
VNRSGQEGFHVTENGELHIDDENVIEEHRIIENRIPNSAIKIVRLPAERCELINQYGENGFRLYELPAPTEGSVVGLLELAVRLYRSLRLLQWSFLDLQLAVVYFRPIASHERVAARPPELSRSTLQHPHMYKTHADQSHAGRLLLHRDTPPR